jgi:Na+-transporting methylmalonyl-CoA/oxaloacetate decarboxylase gamma subunit
LAREESGAALVVTLGVFLFMWVVCCGVYAIGENVRRKIEIQNAADAAAYSAAAVQADFLSRVAAVNRAMAWTYVQMTRRQMDSITKEWMKKSLERIEGDRTKMKSIHRKWCLGWCNGKHPSNSPGYTTFWCGLHGINGVFSINSDLSIMVPNVLEAVAKTYANSVLTPLEMLRNRKSGASLGGIAGLPLKQQLAYDKLNISALNLTLLEMMFEYPGKVDETVKQVIEANLPTEEHGEFLYTCVRQQAFGWFDQLHNTKKEEKRFLIFAGDYSGKSANQIFNEGVISGRKAGGVNHWFVRAKDEASGVAEPSATSGTAGICRCYRKLNGQKKPETVANCKNSDMDGDSDPKKSTALVSEWHHNAWGYICFPVWGGWVHIPLPFALMLEGGKCQWYSSSSTISSRKNCTWPVILDAGQVLPGGGRAYGDDPELVSQLGWTTAYAGQRCKPVVLSGNTQGFFGKGGSILVGLARKAENPWDKVFGRISEGVYKAFDPAQSVTYLWAVAAARAGYKKWGDKDTYTYQLGYATDEQDDYRTCWNLRQTDWDALYVPVKHAWDYCMSSGSGAIFVPTGAGNPLQTVMKGDWKTVSGGGGQADWQNVAAPRGMSGSLNWAGLNERVRH